MWCDARCDGAMHYVANIWKCSVEYMECGVMWYVIRCEMECNARCGVVHNVADTMVRFETDMALLSVLREAGTGAIRNSV